jgi:predicted site-specific integrase-resolvase
MVGEDGSVTIEAAAELMGIDVRVIREWSAIGSLRIGTSRRRGGRAPRSGEDARSISAGFWRRRGAAAGGAAIVAS